MAILNILRFPDPRLRQVAKPVTTVDDSIRTLTRDMLETMYQVPGIGLAASQVNEHKRIVVIDISEEKNQPLILINPEIITEEGSTQYEEGCLSVPGVYENVSRAEKIRIRALDTDGYAFEMDADGLLAICIQHEIDHLEGKLFVDYLSSLKRQRIRKKLEKEERQKELAPDAAMHRVI